MLDDIEIILVETSHPGNIGAAARAMKTMGLQKLVLVSPVLFPHADATARAAGADDLLQNARVVESLEEALSHAEWVIGCSARERTLSRQLYEPYACARLVSQSPRKVAFVFGRERNGLTNEELSLCHDQVCIPANPDYSSLNLSAAVQIICYELRMASLSNKTAPAPTKQADPLASAAQVAGFYQHLEETLVRIGFLDVKQPKKLMERLKLLFNRTSMSVRELNILRGILTATEITRKRSNSDNL